MDDQVWIECNFEEEHRLDVLWNCIDDMKRADGSLRLPSFLRFSN